MPFKKGHKGFRTKESYKLAGVKIANNFNSKKTQFKKGSSGFTGKHTEETKRKIREARARQGSNVWNKDKKGMPWSGKPRTEEWKNKMRLIFKGKPRYDLREENSSNWKGGITPIVRQVRNCFKYKEWRSNCYERDNYICQICEVKGGKLNVDHFPKTFSFIFNDNNIKNYQEALDCEELWNTNNGRTLCEKCHKKYGENSRNKKRS